MTTHLHHLGIPDLPARAFQRSAAGTIRPQGGKNSKPDAPDFGPMAAASEEAARIGAQLGREQLAENKSQFQQNMAVAAPIIAAQKGIMDQTMAQGQDYYDYMRGTFRPIEQGLADEAQSGTSRYDTNANVRLAVEREASRARADVARATENAQQQNQRAMLAMGVNPNSGRFAALQVADKLAGAGMQASAQTQARDRALALDYAKRLDVTGLGRNLPGASQGAYGVATGAGSSAVGNQNQTAAQYLAGLTAGNGLIMQGQGAKMQGLSNILNAQTSMYNAQLANQDDGFFGSLGGVLGGAASLISLSDRRVKEHIVRVATDARGFGLYEFNYLGDAQRYRGVMADEIARVVPEAVVQVGRYAGVDYGRLGLRLQRV